MNGKILEQANEARKQAKMSQAELASATGITQTTISHWERACKHPDSAKPFLLISMALLVSIDYLFCYDDMTSALSAKEKKTNGGASQGNRVLAIVRVMMSSRWDNFHKDTLFLHINVAILYVIKEEAPLPSPRG